MKKNLMNWMLTVTLLLGIGTFGTACSDDDDDKADNEQPAGGVSTLDNDEADAAWRWLSQLSSVEALSNDWATKTYEPTVGEPSEQNTNTRIVVVSDLDEAKALFANLADIDPSLLSGTYTATQSGVGTLTWTPSAAGAQNLAEVTVDTKLIPTLQRIVYCTEEQRGENGWFSPNVDGTAYYRLGDVICDFQGYYWVCVRPAFKQEDKGKSHWINIINASETGRRGVGGDLVPMPQENIYSNYDNLTKYGNHTILLPYQLAYSREHMNNFTNLLWALLNPRGFKDKMDQHGKKNGLCGFDYQYHGMTFLQSVAGYWDQPIDSRGERNIWQLLFNRSHENMTNAQHVRLLYKGYQWRIGRTGYTFEFHSAKDEFNLNTPGSESGDKVLYSFADEGFDVRRICGDPAAEGSNAVMNMLSLDGLTNYYVVRYKTGDQLENGSLSPYESISACQDIYRYNEKKKVNVHSALETETGYESVGEPLDKPKVGCLIGNDGNFYADKTACDRCHVDPVALVVHYGQKGSVEEGSDYRGLAISLERLKAPKAVYEWGDIKTDINTPVPSISENKIPLNGIKCTEANAKLDAWHTCPAAYYCWNYNPMGAYVRDNKGFSHWFLGSVGQWILALKGLGYEWEGTSSFKGSSKNEYYEGAFLAAGLDESDLRTDQGCIEGMGYDSMFWTSTVSSDEEVYGIGFWRNGSVSFKTSTYYTENFVRPLIAF